MKLGELMEGMGVVLIAVMAVVLIFSVTAAALRRPYDDTDPPGKRSGLGLYQDNLTGCEYLTVPFAGMTPRLDENGKHICRKQP